MSDNEEVGKEIDVEDREGRQLKAFAIKSDGASG
jgi:hypothetical protein